MATDIILPNAGFDTQSARIIEWLVKPGDSIAKGDVIAIIESDKANVELESIAAGVVLDILYQEDTEVPVGATIAHVGSAGEQAATATPTAASTPASAEASSAAPTNDNVRVSPLAHRLATEHQLDPSTIAGSGPKGRVTREDVERHLKQANGAARPLALPKVRRVAREAGIDLAQVTPTGADGQITLADVQAYQPQAAPVASASQTQEAAPVVPVDEPRDGMVEVPLSRMRQTIASRLQKSAQEAPHFYVTGEFDVEAALATLAALPEPRPRINDLIQYLTVRTLLRVPQLNATFENGHLYQHQGVHLAIAVSREDGLLTPVLCGADRFNLHGLMQESRALIARTRDNRLQASDLSGGTFTISNLGVVPQVDHFTAVINPPQVAILAVGTMKQRPVIIDGGFHAHHTVHLTVSGDHRVVDGMTLAGFLAVFQQELDTFTR
ncbi:MAG: 2-oxo acid dehydrogenase subunit E2 [Anaerolineae bacterium]|nr:2-oxo acid dehydrogenase subunit E2 [Anaerolineae bacterium]